MWSWWGLTSLDPKLMGLHLYSPVRCFTIYSPLRPVPRVQEQAIFLRCMMGAGPLVSRDRGMVPRLAPSRPAPPAPLPHIYISCACDKRDQRGRAPSPTLAPTDPVPAGPRTAGRLRTRHLARKFGNLDAQNTWGSHTPPSLPFFACVILSPRSGAAWEAGDAQADPPCFAAERHFGQNAVGRERRHSRPCVVRPAQRTSRGYRHERAFLARAGIVWGAMRGAGG